MTIALLGSAATGTGATISHTLNAGADRVVIATVAYEANDQSPVTATYGGNAMTQVTGSPVTVNSGNTIHIYYILESSLPSDGANTFDPTGEGTNGRHLGCVSFSGVNQSSPIDYQESAVISGTVASVTLNSTQASSLYFAALVNSTAGRTTTWSSDGGGPVELWDGNGSGSDDQASGMYEIITASGNNQVTATESAGGNIALIGITFSPVSAGVIVKKMHHYKTLRG